jgi:hypothetical protein
MQLTRFDDEPDSTKLARVALFGIFVANVVEFMVSAQAYSDALLVLMTSFLLGCLMSTPVLADRVKEATAQATSAMAPPVRVGALA